MRGKFLSIVILLEFLFFLLGIFTFPFSSIFDLTRFPNWFDVINLILTSVLSVIGLFFIWKMQKLGVYLFFIPFLWTTPLIFLQYTWGEVSQEGLVYSLVGSVLFIVGPLVLAIARKWKNFK